MNLRSDQRQNVQGELDFSSPPAGDAREARREETESPPAMHAPESPASTNRLMEEVCERENLKEALRQVKGNKGSAGVDGITVNQLTDYLKQHWPVIREQLLSGTYEPKPVRRVEIPKPDGGVRKLGIPTVLDRLIQQAVMQVLQRQWDSTFSDHSYGFRPGRSAHQAVAQAQQYIAAGYGWVIDLDLEKFFDRVNHDKLMGQIAKRVLRASSFLDRCDGRHRQRDGGDGCDGGMGRGIPHASTRTPTCSRSGKRSSGGTDCQRRLGQ